MSEISRRQFLEFMGRSATLAGAFNFLPGCVNLDKSANPSAPFTPLKPSQKDDLLLAKGFKYNLLLKWRQKLNNQGELFGYNNDFIAYLPFSSTNPYDGLMWVNHEYTDPWLNSGWKPGFTRTKAQVDIERKEVGGSIVHIRKNEGRWSMVKDSKFNRRLDAFTPIPIISEQPILGKKIAIGTLGNCAGGVTPWGTVLTCEENYQNFVGEAVVSNGKRTIQDGDQYLSWIGHVDLPPEHYGWVVEVDLKTGRAQKLTALGRFSHECATTTLATDGRCVVYSGDDSDQEHIYKFIAAKPGSLEKGSLYVADTINGRWLPLDRQKDQRLKQAFNSHTQLLISTRAAAKIVGATPLDRPEDIEIDPISGAVFVTLTNSRKNNNPYGSIMKIVEKDNSPLSMEFQASNFVSGGQDFACPDNLVFDRKGNLWMCTDMSYNPAMQEQYGRFGNNGLFYIPLSGKNAGRAFQVASSPPGAELTGPCFAPDYKTLFLSVQHPGERGHDPSRIASHWPDGKNATPAPCVVAIDGPTLEQLTHG